MPEQQQLGESSNIMQGGGTSQANDASNVRQSFNNYGVQ